MNTYLQRNPWGKVKRSVWMVLVSMCVLTSAQWAPPIVTEAQAEIEIKCVKGNCENGWGIAEYYENGELSILWKGNFRDGKLHGEGIREVYYKNGELDGLWKGNFRYDRLHGEGVREVYDKSGDLLWRKKGNFRDGLNYGEAILEGYYENGDLRYRVKGTIENYGLLGHKTVDYFFYEDSNTIQVKVTGNWNEGKVQGRVNAETTVDGEFFSRYEGEADSPEYDLNQERLQEKYGVDRWYFKHGRGKLTYADGTWDEGRWEQGKPVDVVRKGLDEDPPAINVTSHDPKNGMVTVPPVPETFITGTVTDASEIAEVTVNGKAVSLGASGNFSVDVPLKSGRTKIEIMARDEKGHTGWNKFWVATQQAVQNPVVAKQPEPPPSLPEDTESQDTSSPKILITSHDMGSGIAVVPKLPSILIAGRVEDESGIGELTVNGKKAYMDASGNFSAEVRLEAGDTKVQIVARDEHGNTAWNNFWLKAVEVELPEMLAKAPSTTSGKALNIKGDFHALIIGINDYRHLPRLRTAVNDARAVDRILREQYGFSTQLLIDPDRDQMLVAFDAIRHKVDADDHLLIYYAGHGIFDKTVDKAYWLPADADARSDIRWLIVDRITTTVRRMPAKHVLIVADSCYSGTLTRNISVQASTVGQFNRYLGTMFEKASRTLIASGGNEPVADGGGSGHSVFARAFLEALKNPGMKAFTAEQLFRDHIKERVAGFSQQIPEYKVIQDSGHEGGDFVFIQR